MLGVIVLHPPHTGESYETFLAELTAKRTPKHYLEVGVSAGNVLARVTAQHAVGVDPNFVIAHNIAAHKQSVSLYQYSSDVYFSHARPAEPFDFIFLDGMHVFEYLLRDFYNAERLSHRKTLIAMHDCMPLNGDMADRIEAQAVSKGASSPYAGWWTGDVWKIIPILKEYRPDLKLVFLDCPPTGLVFVTGLDPSSDVLDRSYLEIVEKYAAIPNTTERIERLYETFAITSSASITHEMDHSLYFAT